MTDREPLDLQTAVRVLASMDALEYEDYCRYAAQRLGFRVTALGRIVKEWRAKIFDHQPEHGKPATS